MRLAHALLQRVGLALRARAVGRKGGLGPPSPSLTQVVSSTLVSVSIGNGEYR